MTSAQNEIHPWSAGEFERQVFESHPRVAVFDCDGTLWGGDSGYGFLAWSLDEGLVSRSTSDWIDARYRAYRAGSVSEEDICGEMVQIYAGLRDDELRDAAARFANLYVQPRIFPEMAALVARMREAEIDLWAVSSTCRWVVAEGVRVFGIPENRILAADVRVVDGVITSQIVDVPTGAAKAEALKRIGLSSPDAVFGNSLHDLAMLELARHPFPVNPSPSLQKEAVSRGWGYYVPRDAARFEIAVGGES